MPNTAPTNNSPATKAPAGPLIKAPTPIANINQPIPNSLAATLRARP